MLLVTYYSVSYVLVDIPYLSSASATTLHDYTQERGPWDSRLILSNT